MAIDNVLSKLSSVKKKGPGKWSACCPAHEDRSPSLSIQEVGDGRVLLYCFGGCNVHDVLCAMGLGIEELFPPPEKNSKFVRRGTFSKREIIEALGKELTVAWTLLQDISTGRPLGETDRERAAIAAKRCAALIREISTQ
jgi:hypothetical protein